MFNNRPLIAIIAARASEYEQRVMIEETMAQAEKYGMGSLVISNIYNFREYYASVEVENKIYELIQSERLDGIIFMAECVNDPELKLQILDELRKVNVPIIITGNDIKGFTCVDNDIRGDFRRITDHLIDEHGIIDIDILTGQEDIQTSHDRVAGVRDALAARGITLSDSRVIFGNYWNTSGESAAKEYISGQRRLPKAIICANDYMAYGLIDELFNSDIRMPDDVTVIGYEYSGDRIYHFPVLTTYDRNRSAVGAKAVSMIHSMITGEPAEDIPLDGCMICGDSCACGCDKRFMGRELNRVRTEHFYSNLNISGQFEQHLTACRSIDDYIGTLARFTYLLRDLKGLYVCLYENWCSLTEKTPINVSSNEEIMTLYRVMSPLPADDTPRFFKRRSIFPDDLPGASARMFLHIIPMFTGGVEIGHFIFLYPKPDSYDSIALDWINTAVNALNVLRMKNDITELLEYNNLSEFHDSATGLYNKAGFCRELDHAASRDSSGSVLSVVMIKTSLFSDESRIDTKSISVRIDTEIASCLKKLCVDSNCFCAKLPEKNFIFAAVGKLPDGFHDAIADRLTALITHSPIYSAERRADTVVTAGLTLPLDSASPKDIIASLGDSVNAKIAGITERRKNQGFEEFSRIRTEVYRDPAKNWDAAEECRDMHLSCGHFRAAYKNIFGISFHRDVIMSRIAMAKYLLMTTALSLPAIAFKCGYEDDKYFLRQFRQITGISPNTYRKFGTENAI